jgi:hypothetical protein
LDPEHEHVWIAWLWPDPTALQDLLSQLEKFASNAMLIDEELRLNVVAESSSCVLLDRNTPTAFSFYDASQEPSTSLLGPR